MEIAPPRQDHYCYILGLVGDDQVSYIGYTINIARRLRQHNGELAGGARFTTRHGPSRGRQWRVVALVTSPDLDHRQGLSLEWHIRNPDGGRRRRTVGRLKQQETGETTRHKRRGTQDRVLGLAKAMSHGKFAGHVFSTWIIPEYRAVLLQAMVDAKHCSSSIHTWPTQDALGLTDMDVDTPDTMSSLVLVNLPAMDNSIQTSTWT